MLFNIFYNLYNIIILHILSIKAKNTIKIKNDTTVTLSDNNDNFIIKYEIKEIEKDQYKYNDDYYFFYILKNNKKRIFRVERTFLLHKNSIIFYNNKKYKVYIDSKNIKHENNIPFYPCASVQLQYRIIHVLNNFYCVGSKRMDFFEEFKISNLIHLSECPGTITSYSYFLHIFKYDRFDITKKVYEEDIFLNQKKLFTENIKIDSTSHRFDLKTFVIDRKEFKKFLLDSKYFMGKCYESITYAEFIDTKPYITISKCKLIEVINDFDTKNESSSLTSLREKNTNKINLPNIIEEKETDSNNQTLND
ncbi:hypothetical protein EHP00_867 [Ecytonucleospora hepatopenaei]|uniref:Uncharacterized protein n=1 Tax=Ecytonucleospora hepatopenaei TaxID=646526 RepID=A0A1W0E3Z0_9MICR|nr:hypothetical protein EHP00_867 [Ecytonucleospora hepatopenaei]